MSRTLTVSRIHRPVTALGPGRRVGLWVAGCSLGCTGCIATDTWSSEAGVVMPVAEVASMLTDAFGDDETLTGLTVSGGEPLEQGPAVRDLIESLRSSVAGLPGRSPGAASEVDVLLYSGWSRGRADREAPWIPGVVDAFIPEPFVQSRAPGGVWRGSANQPLLLFTDLARARYRSADDAAPTLQVSVAGGRLWTIGVPRPGDMNRMLELAQQRGLSVADVSWQA